jgi:hypothetical protein
MSGKNYLEQAKELLKHIQENPDSIKTESSKSVLDQAKDLLKHVATNPKAVEALTKAEAKPLSKSEEIRQAVLEKWEPRYELAKAKIFDFKTGKKLADLPSNPLTAHGSPMSNKQVTAAKPKASTKAAPVKASASPKIAAPKSSMKPSSKAPMKTPIAKKAPGEEQPKDISDSPVAGTEAEKVSKVAPSPTPEKTATSAAKPRRWIGVRPSAWKALSGTKSSAVPADTTGAKPSQWKKSEIQEMVKEEWSPKFSQKGVHQPISEGSGHSKAGMLSPGAKPGTADAEQAKEEHLKVLAEQKKMKTK